MFFIVIISSSILRFIFFPHSAYKIVTFDVLFVLVGRGTSRLDAPGEVGIEGRVDIEDWLEKVESDEYALVLDRKLPLFARSEEKFHRITRCFSGAGGSTRCFSISLTVILEGGLDAGMTGVGVAGGLG